MNGEVPFRRVRRVVVDLFGPFRSVRAWTWMALALGVVLRLADYATNRGLWMDEEALAANVVGRPIFEFDKPLVRDQLAPPGFLVVERSWVRLAGDSSYSLRAIPLVCGIGTLCATWALARRLLTPFAVPVAIALLAVSDDLIYYSSEFKQYSSDVLIALGCAFLVLGPSRSEGTVGRFLGAFAGGLATWFSFSSIFVLAAGGVWLAATALVRKDWERLIALSVIGAVWLVNFTACYVISKRLLGDGDWMWVWWGFSFLPLPPRSLGDLSSLFWTIANLFTNPAGLDTPISPITTGLLGLGLYGVGLMRWVRDRKGAALAILVGPLALAMVASAARLYPFHGRTILYLAPLLILAVAEGAAIFARPRWRWAAVALVTFFLIVPLGRFAMNFERPRSRMFDSHGDQRNDLLDYLEMRHNRLVAPTPSSTP